jgi:hypothetical protein
MPSTPCKKPCEKGKICNPVSGRCVLRKGKIGKQLLKSRSKSKSRRSKSSKRFKRSKSLKRKKLISPFLALGPDVIRHGIKPFVEAGDCGDLTQKFGCKGPLSVFVDKEGNRKDCAWTCMSDCRPSELMSLINHPKTITFERSDGRTDKSVVNITGYITIFNVSIDNHRDEGVTIWNSKEPGHVVISEPMEMQKIVSNIDATRILCRWFQKWTEEGRRIEISSEIEIRRFDDPPRGSRIVQFEHPWIRPIREWEIKWGQRPRVVLEAQIDNVE